MITSREIIINCNHATKKNSRLQYKLKKVKKNVQEWHWLKTHLREGTLKHRQGSWLRAVWVLVEWLGQDRSTEERPPLWLSTHVLHFRDKQSHVQNNLLYTAVPLAHIPDSTAIVVFLFVCPLYRALIRPGHRKWKNTDVTSKWKQLMTNRALGLISCSNPATAQPTNQIFKSETGRGTRRTNPNTPALFRFGRYFVFPHKAAPM